MLSHRARYLAGLLLVALLVPIVVLPLRELPSVPVDVHAPGVAPGPRVADTPLNATVDISPGTWTMAPGDSVNLSATFVGIPGGCATTFEWFAWTLVGPSLAQGYLNGSAGATVRVTADPGATRAIVVSALGTVAIECSGTSSVTQTAGTVIIELLPPLAIPGWSVSPNPAPPGDLVDLRWTVEGGLGPYAVTVDFGDGTSSTVPQASPGDGGIFHRFPSGEFAPEITVLDARGSRTESAVLEPLVSDPGLAVSIAPGSAGPEVGRPFVDNGTITGGAGPIQYTWSVNGSAVSTGQSPDVPVLRFAPTSAGAVTVLLTAVDGARESGSAEQNLTVAPPVGLAIAAARSGGDVGRPMLLNLSLTGGIAPYAVSWSTPSGGSPGTVTVATGGTQLLALVPGSPGPLVLDATVVDAAGGLAGGTFELGNVGVGPSAALASPDGPIEAGVPLDVGLEIVGGAGPFEWSIEPSLGVEGVPADSGRAIGGAPVNWSGTPTSAGSLTVTALVVDAFGGFAETNRTLTVVPGLALSSVLSNVSGPGAAGLTVFAEVGGGVPPYALVATCEGVSASMGNLTTAGGYTLRLPDPPSGFDAVRVVVTDALGVNRSRSGTAFVDPVASGPAPTAPSPASPAAASSGLVGATAAGVLLVAAVPLGFWWLRRRTPGGGGRGTGTDSGRALALVRRSLSTGDGLDPETLALIGEEEGIPAVAVESAIHQWERLGRLRREPDPSGGELIHWTPATPPSVPHDDPGALA